MNMTRAVIYVRISKDREGAGLGVDRQREDCVALAERMGWLVVGTYTDNDISAYSGKLRPGYTSMMKSLEQGDADAIIAWHTDRLHRSPRELESFIDLCERQGLSVQTVRAGVIDLSNASGRMVARMLGAAARHEVEHAVERQKRAKMQAAMDGKYRGGRRPFGYESDGVTVRPQEAAELLAATQRVLAGVSLSQIAREWNGRHVLTTMGNTWRSREGSESPAEVMQRGTDLSRERDCGTGPVAGGRPSGRLLCRPRTADRSFAAPGGQSREEVARLGGLSLRGLRRQDSHGDAVRGFA